MASSHELSNIGNVVNVIKHPLQLQVPLAFAALFQKKLNDDKMHGVTSYARALSLVSAGYFVADTSIVLKHFKEHGPEPLAHAIICVTFFVFSALKEKMQYWVPRTLMFECSTPLVHLRWLLHALGRSKTPFYKVNGLAMIGVFAACRIIYGTRALFHRHQLWKRSVALSTVPCIAYIPQLLTCRISRCHVVLANQLRSSAWRLQQTHIKLSAGLVWDLQVCCHRYLKNWPPKTGPGANDPISKTTCRIMAGMGCGITVLNFFWFYKMCRGAVKVFRKPSQPKQGNAQMQAPGQAPPAVGSTQPEHGAGPSAPGAQQARLGGVDARLKGLEAHGTPATAGDVAAGDDNGNGIEVIDVPDRL
jgi:TLC domain